jgi:hypothetical protein
MGEVPHYIIFLSLSIVIGIFWTNMVCVRLIVISKIELLPQSVQMAITKVEI